MGKQRDAQQITEHKQQPQITNNKVAHNELPRTTNKKWYCAWVEERQQTTTKRERRHNEQSEYEHQCTDKNRTEEQQLETAHSSTNYATKWPHNLTSWRQTAENTTRIGQWSKTERVTGNKTKSAYGDVDTKQKPSFIKVKKTKHGKSYEKTRLPTDIRKNETYKTRSQLQQSSYGSSATKMKHERNQSEHNGIHKELWSAQCKENSVSIFATRQHRRSRKKIEHWEKHSKLQ